MSLRSYGLMFLSKKMQKKNHLQMLESIINDSKKLLSFLWLTLIIYALHCMHQVGVFQLKIIRFRFKEVQVTFMSTNHDTDQMRSCLQALLTVYHLLMSNEALWVAVKILCSKNFHDKNCEAMGQICFIFYLYPRWIRFKFY